MIILPSTFIVSSRYIEQLYQDAMVVVRKKGKTDLFITTCNPNWKEIQEIYYKVKKHKKIHF